MTAAHILIVEDVEYRQKYLASQLTFEPLEIQYVKLADKGLKALQEEAFDIVFLDHDLIGARTGSFLTMDWARKHHSFKTQKPLVIIHSMNTEGTRKMEAHLKGIARKV